ncbi:hypothetical protein [Eisenibacter elegans]|uniref:hypothetical protein n=1 Tax=Eisenibacter elegans TaxID=997 RepID=UPI0012B65D08|nr:hypothetical protein [Eisenibacter elegans]
MLVVLQDYPQQLYFAEVCYRIDTQIRAEIIDQYLNSDTIFLDLVSVILIE